ncbi:MAG: N-acetylmuramoyl-L-alanine amidase [Bacilli bacterium]|nr:N-acetylmuramoyl-L-alanine amidase [Bacilli bacterium]
MYKYKITSMLLFFLFFIGLNIVEADLNKLPLKNKIIYLDPGHGGVDPGAMYKSIKEKDINLEISKKLKTALELKGATVYLTRYGDYDLSVPNTINRKRSDLSRRSNMINKSNCDMFLSIHLNAESTNTWSGAQVFYDDINENNIKIAKIIQDIFRQYLNSKRKYKETNDLYLQKRITRPGVLMELGFLSNSNDRYLLKQNYYQNKLARLVTEGVIKYFQS